MKLYASLPKDQLAVAAVCSEALGLDCQEISKDQLAKLDEDCAVALSDEAIALQVPHGLLACDFWNFKRLEELVRSGAVSGVIPIDAPEDVVAALIRKITGLDQAEPVDSLLSDLPPELIEMFEKELYPKLEEVKLLGDQAVKTRSKKDLETLKKRIHKLAGSAGSFGFAHATHLCRQLESALAQAIESDPDAFFQEGTGKSLHEDLLAIILSFQHINVAPDSPVT